MADGKTRIYSLPEITSVDSDMFIMLDSGAVGTRKYNLKTMYDKVDGVTDAAEAAQAAATSATTAATQASNAAGAANAAASQAQSTVQAFMSDATEQMDGLVDDVDAAIDAIGDISEQAVPLMSESTRGGAKLGHGLAIEDGALGIGSVTDATDAGPIVALSAKGWAEQDTTSGKNLLPNGDNGSTTYNGVTITRTNGVMRFSGTATGAGGRTSAFYKTQKVTLDAGTYTFSVETSGTGGATAYVERLSDNGAIANTADTPTFTLTEQTEVYIGYNIRNETAYDLTVKPQIEAGSTATSYEPYSGAKPSPSPSFPQEVRRVTGHTIAGKTGRYVDVDVQGRNLLNPSLFAVSATKSGITYTNNGDGSVTIKGTSTAYSAYYLMYDNHDWSEIRGKVVSMSVDAALPSGVSLGMYNASWTNIGRLSGSTTQTTFTATNAAYIYFDVANGKTVDVTFHPMLELGSTAHAYEPYYHTTIPIPLPSRGWVAALPDGTCDTLTLDGAGGYAWTENVAEYTLNGKSSEQWVLRNTGTANWLYETGYAQFPLSGDSVNFYASHYTAAVIGYSSTNVGMWLVNGGYIRIREATEDTIANFKARLASDPVTVLYPLATPTTESGYVDSMPVVPAHATISSADLTDLSVRCCADEGAAEIAGAWGRRLANVEAELENVADRISYLMTRVS